MPFFPIYYRPAGEPSGLPAQLEAALACEDPTGGDNHRTNGMMWQDVGKLLKPIPQERFWELHATISKVTGAYPFAIRISDGEMEPEPSLEDTVFIWATGDQDFADEADDTMVSLTRQCVFIHDAANFSTVEKLVGFAVLFGVPLVAGPHFSFVTEESFTGYQMPEKARPNASVLRMFDGGKGKKKPE